MVKLFQIILKNVQFTKCAEAFIKKHHVSKKLYVVSGGKQSELHNIFQNLKIFHYFNFIYGNPLSKVENMKKLFSEFNIEKEILFIGDSKVDFDVAKKFNIDFFLLKITVRWSIIIHSLINIK